MRLANPKPVKHRLGLQPQITHSWPNALRVYFSEANPFAKKVEMGPPKTGVGIGSRNPAAVGPQKSLHKSETFFEKVEAAETSTGPPKREPEPSLSSYLPW